MSDNNNNTTTCWSCLRIDGNGLHCQLPGYRFRLNETKKKNPKKLIDTEIFFFCRMKHNVRHSYSHSKCVVTNYTTLIVVRYIRYVQCTPIQCAILSTWIICSVIQLVKNFQFIKFDILNSRKGLTIAIDFCVGEFSLEWSNICCGFMLRAFSLPKITGKRWIKAFYQIINYRFIIEIALISEGFFFLVSLFLHIFLIAYLVSELPNNEQLIKMNKSQFKMYAIHQFG